MSDARTAIHYPAVRWYLLSTAFAAVGLNVLVTVLFKQVFDITGDELDIGFVGLAQFVPAVLLVLVSGWVADRFDRRRITSLFLLGRVGCAVALVVYSRIDPGSVWQLFVIAFVFGGVDAMMAPARRSMAPFLAPPEHFPRVVALWTATFTGSAIVGPVIGGFLYSVGPPLAYGLVAVLQLAAIPPILAISYHREPERITDRPTPSAVIEGLRFVRRTPVVLATISLDLFAVLFGGAVALIPAVASERLGVGDIAYGWLRAAPGIGAAVMALFLAVRPVWRRVGPTLFIRGSIVPLVTPDEQLGRVTAVEGVFIGASNELGAFESGVAARAFGLPWAIAGGGFITVAIAAGFAVVFPSLRRIDRFDELRPARSGPS